MLTPIMENGTVPDSLDRPTTMPDSLMLDFYPYMKTADDLCLPPPSGFAMMWVKALCGPGLIATAWKRF